MGTCRCKHRGLRFVEEVEELAASLFLRLVAHLMILRIESRPISNLLLFHYSKVNNISQSSHSQFKRSIHPIQSTTATCTRNHLYLYSSLMTGPIRSSSSTTSTSSTISDRPLNGVFGLEKPSGPTSMSLLEALKPLFARSILFRNKDGSVPDERSSGDGNKKGRKFRGRNKNKLQPPKIGQGGTLDPLADGVLVVGVGKGTKQLAGFLDCTKVSTGIYVPSCSYD